MGNPPALPGVGDLYMCSFQHRSTAARLNIILPTSQHILCYVPYMVRNNPNRLNMLL